MEQLIFTDWPRGQGVEPAASGLQIKACSEGITANERWQLASVSMHLGQAYSPMNAPRSAVEREQGWLSKAQNLHNIPVEVLKNFPVIWSYHCLSEHRFALIRTHYTCLTHDQRTGNFFAHAIVLDPANLDPQFSNPFTLAQSGLFLTEHLGSETNLSALSEAIAKPAVRPAIQPLQQEPFRQHLAAMLSALSTASTSRRPVILCLDDWRLAEPVTAALLELLPPAARCQITFSTYESDRTWSLPSKSGQPASLAQHLIVLCSEGNRSWNLRSDEYQNAYTVFNFAENRFSELGELRPYAAFGAACALDGKMDHLYEVHRLLDRFGAGTNLAAWDQFQVVAQISQVATSETLTQAAQALADFTASAEPSASETALELFAPHIQSLAQEDDPATLLAISPLVAAWVERLSASGEATIAAKSAPFTDSFFALSDQAFSKGQVRTTKGLLKACGPGYDTALLELLTHQAKQPPTALPKPAAALDQAEAFNLMLDALRLVEKMPNSQPPIEWLLSAAFYTAKIAGQSADAWKRLGEVLVKPRLATPWDDTKEKLAQELLQSMPAEDCPEANIWLNTKILHETKPQGSTLTALLCDLAKAGAHSPQAEKVIGEVLNLAQKHFEVPEQLAMGLGLLTNAVTGTSSQSTLETAYREALKKLPSNRLNHLRRELADAGAARLLCREILDEILPWKGGESPQKLLAWQESVLAQRPAVLDELLLQIADQLSNPTQSAQIFPLVEELVLNYSNQLAQRPAGPTLFNVVAGALPLSPLSRQWEQALSVLKCFNPEAEERIRVLKFMRQMEQQGHQLNWTLAQFPVQDAVWKEDARKLPAADRQQLCRWYIDLISGCGINRSEDAQLLASAYQAIDENAPQTLASGVTQLLEGRDPVTIVLTLAAFANCALEDPLQSAAWLPYLRAILARFNRDIQTMFALHLQRRFGYQAPGQPEQVELLLVNLELIRPRPTPPPYEATKRESIPPISGRRPTEPAVKSMEAPIILPNLVQIPIILSKKLFNLLFPSRPQDLPKDSSTTPPAASREPTSSSTVSTDQPQNYSSTKPKLPDANQATKKNKRHGK